MISLSQKFKNKIRSWIPDSIKKTYYRVRKNIAISVATRKREAWLSPVEIAEYRKKIKIYDAFIFFNEIETLEIRLNILDEYVDYFIIVESTETHAGKQKKLFYEENKELFKKWHHKIIHYVVRDSPSTKAEFTERLTKTQPNDLDKEVIKHTLENFVNYSPETSASKNESYWLKEHYQRECIKKALIGMSDNDFCFISDLDEIWNPCALVDYSKDDIFYFEQTVYNYYLNNRSDEYWTGTIGTKYKNIGSSSINKLKHSRGKQYTLINNGGWHFSYQGGIDRIESKIESYGHQENNTNAVKSKLKQKLEKNTDIFDRKFNYKKDESQLPLYLLKNKEKYKKFFS